MIPYPVIFIAIFFVAQASSQCSTPSTFGSFSGKPANSLNDCFWDFVQCTEFEDRRCCDDRYYSCCQWIMQGMAMSSNFVEPPASTSTTTTTTTTTPKPYQHADSLIGCIWQFNSCVQARFRGGDESVCYLRYDDCKMIVMGMMPMQQDQEFANELPSPINMMNGVATTQKPRPLPAETSQTKPRPRITLIQCLWSFFGCNGAKCDTEWNSCMTDAMNRKRTP